MRPTKNNTKSIKDCGVCQVVSVLVFYSKDQSLIPAEVTIFLLKLLLKRMKIYKKRPGKAYIKQNKLHKLNVLKLYWVGLCRAPN